jgi:hypothetical protein
MNLTEICNRCFYKSFNINRKLKYGYFNHFILSDNINGQIQFIHLHNCYTKHLLRFVDLQNNLEFYNLSCLSFVQGLKYKWISAQEPRLIMGYKSLIKNALGLGLVRLKLG